MCDGDFADWLLENTEMIETLPVSDGSTVRVHQYSQDDHAAWLAGHCHDVVTGYTPRPDSWYTTHDPIQGQPRGSKPYDDEDTALAAAALAAGAAERQAA